MMQGFRQFVFSVRRRLVVVLVLLASVGGRGAEDDVAHPYETDGVFVSTSAIDEFVSAGLRARGIEPAALCSDAVFVRRVFLDVIGTLPQPWETTAFLQSNRPAKRAELIEGLFDRDEFADYWSLKWCDLLRVKAEFPINLWPNAVQAYHRWVHDAVRENMRYDAMARELLTSSGSNFRVPAVNFYRAIQGREPSAIASAVALTFMGERVEAWPARRRAGFEAFFSRVAYKGTAGWKEEIVFLDPASTRTLKAVFPDGVKVKIRVGEDPRVVFADWLIGPDNAGFARNIVNRQWFWLFGRGIIDEPDDIRPDNPAVHPELLAYLEKELVDSGYDMRHTLRLMLNSHTYQRSSIPRSDHPDGERLFAQYAVRRLDAEVLLDALNAAFGGFDSYSSAIPEPFTFIPDQHRSIELADGSITSQFLEMFGRPARDTGLASERNNAPTDAQRLHMLNSTHIQKKIQQSNKLRQLLYRNRGKRKVLIRGLYVQILSRAPTPAEMRAALDYFQTDGVRTRQAVADTAWALTNSKEFLYRH